MPNDDGISNKPLNRSMQAARASKQDEFYTQLSDIEKELRRDLPHFKGQTVLCNCDDPKVSNFFHYFTYNLERLGLKKLITTCYKNQKPDLFSKNECERGICLEYGGGNRVPDPADIGIYELKGDGDFRSDECVALMERSDIVVTNPPFSLFREYVEQLIKHGKKFLIIGSQNAISYKEIFPLIKDNRIWLGYTKPEAFVVPDHYEARKSRSWRDAAGTNWRSLGNACWFTNLDIEKRHEDLVLYKTYNPVEYPRYHNCEAIEVSRYARIPCDYGGAMGVPVTFLEKHNPDQFEILGSSVTLGEPMSAVAPRGTFKQGGRRFYLAKGDGTYQRLFDRLVIRNKRL